MSPFLRPGRALALLSCAVLLLAGCTTLPRSGPTAIEIRDAAREAPAIPMRLIDVAPDTLPDAAAGAEEQPDIAALLDDAPATRLGAIGPGDVLQITVFEIGARLFSGGGLDITGGTAASAGTAGQTLPPLTVDEHGRILFPYVGRIAVGGLTPDVVANEIEARLVGLSQRAQVSVAVRDVVTSAVYVMGAVRTAGRIPLGFGGERLLDAVARAGGATEKPADLVVRFTRGPRRLDVALDAIMPAGPYDLVLRPGDRIELLPRIRSFTVFGATDKVSEIPFEAPRLSLAQAVARAGGPSDRQADPSAVFLFRYRRNPADDGPGEAVIYRLNLMRPESYFLAQNFAMRHGDVLYIANARSNQATKFVQIINQLFSPFFTARELTR